jgi:hypothetical protein
MEIVSQNSSYPNKRHEISKQYNTYRMNKQYRKWSLIPYRRRILIKLIT